MPSDKKKSPLNPARKIIRKEMRDYRTLLKNSREPQRTEWERALYVCDSILLEMSRREGKKHLWTTGTDRKVVE
jgi:hypothetical protein